MRSEPTSFESAASGTAAYIALGSNLGDRLGYLHKAVEGLHAHSKVRVTGVSPVYGAAAHTLHPEQTRPDYLNAVVAVETVLSPGALLDVCLALERQHGRDRRHEDPWGPRTLDLDLLVYGRETRDLPSLKLPHPRLDVRRFVLQPLADLAPGLHVPPPFDARVADLLAACPDDAPLTPTDHALSLPLAPANPDTPASPAPAAIPLRDDLRYVVIEGVIGAGKSTLARLIAEQFRARLVLEEFDENPFLARFYEDRPRWAFQTQLSFLASRFRQQQSLNLRDLFYQLVVSDYSFDKDRIFAQLNLNGDELHLYETMYSIMRASIPTPDLLVYLQSTPERLMHNIRQRGRSYERDMDPDYITALNDAYNQYFFHYTKSPLLIINATNIDFVKNPAELDELIRQIASKQNLGTTYFNPTASDTLYPTE